MAVLLLTEVLTSKHTYTGIYERSKEAPMGHSEANVQKIEGKNRSTQNGTSTNKQETQKHININGQRELKS